MQCGMDSLNEGSQMPRTGHWVTRPRGDGRSRHTANTRDRSLITYGWNSEQDLPINGLGRQFFEDESVKTGLWREDAEVCTVSIHHWIIHLQQAVFIICNLYLNESITKQNKTSFSKEKKLLHLLTYLLHYCYSLSHKNISYLSNFEINIITSL